MADLPVIHAQTPIEELPLPPLSTGWSQPPNFAPLRIFRQGKRVFFTGALICGTNVSSGPFQEPLPVGWRPSGKEAFPVVSPKGLCLFTVNPNGNFTWEYGDWGLGRGSWFTMNTISYLAKN